MHMSESFRSRRSVGFNRRFSSSGEKEGDAKDKCAEDGGDRGSDATPSFSRSRKLQPGKDRRPLQRFYSKGTFALPRIARGTAAAHIATTTFIRPTRIRPTRERRA